jgi:hypothetical protein
MFRIPRKLKWGLKITLEDGTIISAGRETNKSKKYMKEKYPVGSMYNIGAVEDDFKKIVKVKIDYYFNYFVIWK